MLEAMKYHFRHLTDFSGGDARQTFWYWFLFLFIVNIGVGIAMTIPMTAGAMSSALEVAPTGDPEAVRSAMISEMATTMRPLIMGAIIVGLANLALIAAALVRRLHDSGRSGVWAALVGAIYLVSLWLTWDRAKQMTDVMVKMAATTDPTVAIKLQSSLAWQSLLGYVPWIMVILFGVMKSDPGPNKYGAEPVRF